MKNEKEPAKLFIKIILYLLLALAFFSTYYVEQNIISTGVIAIFLSAIVSLIALTIVYIKKSGTYWAVISILPFSLILVFNLMLLYYGALDIRTDFIKGVSRFFWELMNAESITATLLILDILIIYGLWKKKK